MDRVRVTVRVELGLGLGFKGRVRSEGNSCTLGVRGVLWCRLVVLTLTLKLSLTLTLSRMLWLTLALAALSWLIHHNFLTLTLASTPISTLTDYNPKAYCMNKALSTGFKRWTLQ